MTLPVDILQRALATAKQKQGSPLMLGDSAHGVISQPNIDLNHRPIVHNPDGSISTIRSATFQGDNGQYVLLPTVVGGKIVSNNDAWQHYVNTGEHLGTYSSEAAADYFANKLHEGQANEYLPSQGIKQAARNRQRGKK